MHDWLHFAHVYLADASSTATIKVALIAGLALMVSSAIPTLAGKKEKEPKVLTQLRAAELQLRKQVEAERDEYKASYDTALHGMQLRDDRIEADRIEIQRLRDLLWKNLLNPDTGGRREPT